MTDRELLELAAKAAGLEFECAFTGGDLHMWANRKLQLLRIWNPLKDDGDALRLLAILRMETYTGHDDEGKPEQYVGYPSKSRQIHYVAEPHGADAAAAIRRAIVRAAAAIGESHEEA
jgi:hypothetical protein